MIPELRLLIFIVAVFYVLITAVNFFLVAVYRRVRRIATPQSRAYLFWSRVCLFVAAVGTICIAYGYYIEPYWPEVTHIRLKTSKLAKGTPPIRLVLISDIHSETQTRLEPRLPQLIADQKPDMIFYAGDSANHYDSVPVFHDVIKKIGKIAPTYAVKGNWDVFIDLEKVLQDTDVKLLAGTTVRQDVRGVPIWIAGASEWHEDQVYPPLRQIPRSEFSIFMHHTPDGFPEIAREKIDLYLAGHTHGGQIALPFYGAIITNSHFDKRYEKGLFMENGSWMYVTRGIGMTAIGVRFLARPEITVIDLVPAE